MQANLIMMKRLISLFYQQLVKFKQRRAVEGDLFWALTFDPYMQAFFIDHPYKKDIFLKKLKNIMNTYEIKLFGLHSVYGDPII